MNKHIKKIIIRLATTAVVVMALMCGGLWLFRTRNVSIAETEEPTDEQFEQFFADYAEMTASYDPENLLIVMSEGQPETYGATEVVDAPDHTYFLMYDSVEKRDEAYARLEQDNLISVEKNTKMELLEYNSWGIAAMGLDEAREAIGYGGNAVKVAIIDTGLDIDLFRQSYPNIAIETYDVETSSSYTTMVDKNGHGTHVAGTIAEGMPKNGSLYIIRAMRGSEEQMYSADVLAAIEMARVEDVNVINMSLGAYDKIPSQETAIGRALERGTVTVAAAGNHGRNTVMYPAGYSNTIAVSAVNQDLTLADYSNYGSEIDFAAPGTDIVSINGNKSGTSMATPHVVAAVATLKSFNSSLGLDATKTLLNQYAQDLGEEGWDQQFGYGFIDLNGAEYCDPDEYCDEYGVFAAEAPVYSNMVINEVTLTPVNYYSISNLMLTEVKIFTDETHYETKKLQDVKNLTISGYDPEAHGLQTVTITCEGLSQTLYVINPDDYTPGWEYRLNEQGQVLLTRYYDVLDYDDENYQTSLTRLYVPETINGRDVVALATSQRTMGSDEYTYQVTDTVFERSYYAEYVLKEVHLPETLRTISNETFYGFRKLEEVTMSELGVNVGESAFRNVKTLRKVDGKIITVGEYAFYGDESLEAVEFAEGLTIISNAAFSRCYMLKEIVMPSTVTEIGQNAFSDNKSLELVEFEGSNLRTIMNAAFGGAVSLSSVTLPEGLESIKPIAFRNTAIKRIRIPASVTEIGGGAFMDNSKLAKIIVDEGNQTYYDVDDRVLMRDSYGDKVLVAGTKYFMIPAGTSRINDYAFRGFTSAGMLVIPSSVKAIETDAFYGCVGLTDIVIPKLDYEVGLRAFEKSKEMADSSYDTLPLDAKLWVYYEDEAYDYAIEGGFNYQTIDASYAVVEEPFNYGDTVASDTAVKFYYNYGVLEDGVFTNYTGMNGVMVAQVAEQFTAVEYSGGADCFRVGDTYFTATYKDSLGGEAVIKVAVTVNGEYPEYTVPTGLTGKLRKRLSSVELPAGFSWTEEEDVYLGELGEHTFKAKYTPEDLETYAPVENIDIVVETVPGRVKLADPVVTVDSKHYDGGWNIDESLVHVTIEGLGEDDYWVSANTYDNEVGTTTASVTVYLNWDVEEEYGFGDDYGWYYDYLIEDYEILPVETPELEVENNTGGKAEYEVVADGIIVTAEEACTVLVTSDDGETYTKVLAMWMEGNRYKFNFEITEGMNAIVVLKGDLDMRGTVNARDSSRISYYLLSADNPNRRELTALEQLIADVNDSGGVTVRDASLVRYAILSSDNPSHRALAW